MTGVERRLAIGEVARASGLPVSALRFFDGAGRLTVGGAGDGPRVGVNRDYLLDALTGSGQLVLGLDGPIAPLALRVPGGDWSLLMPVAV